MTASVGMPMPREVARCEKTIELAGSSCPCQLSLGLAVLTGLSVSLHIRRLQGQQLALVFRIRPIGLVRADVPEPRVEDPSSELGRQEVAPAAYVGAVSAPRADAFHVQAHFVPSVECGYE